MTQCSICGGSGFMPFIKNGKVISGIRVYCECRQDEPEHYQPSHVEDIDYPCSDTFRGYFCEQFGGHDPAYSPPHTNLEPIETRLSELEARALAPGAVPRRYEYQLEQVKGQVIHLQTKLNEHTDKTKQKPKQQVKGYQGIK